MRRKWKIEESEKTPEKFEERATVLYA